MQGNPQIIDELNKRLSEELTAIAQYEAQLAQINEMTVSNYLSIQV